MRYELMVGLRYTRARRRNRFVGVNSAVSMIGIALGVWALIVILSVMNGLQNEVRTRILGVAAHVQIIGPAGRLADWREAARIAAGQPHVLAAAPFVEAQAMLSVGRIVRAGAGRGILPEEEERGGGRGARHPARRRGGGGRPRPPYARHLARHAAGGRVPRRAGRRPRALA